MIKTLKAPVRVPCKACGGTGEVELTGIYRDTLLWLRNHPDPQNAAAIARILKVAPTAMANRLTALERMGLVTSERYGRERRWRPLVK